MDSEDRAPARKTSRPRHDLFSDNSDFSDVSFQDSKMEEMRNLGISRHLLSATPSPSRFPKRSQMRAGKHVLPEESPVLGSRPWLSSGAPPTPASRARADAALTRLAQIETRILSRRARAGLPPSEVGAGANDDSLPEEAEETPPRGTAAVPPRNTGSAPQKHARELPAPASRGRYGAGSRFLKKKELPAVNIPTAVQLGKGRSFPAPKEKEPTRTFDSPDSDGEEMKVLLGSLTESSREKENQGFTSTKVSKRKRTKRFSKDDSMLTLPGEELFSPRLSGTPQLPTPPSSGRTLSDSGSRTPSPPTRDPGSLASDPGTRSRSPSTRGRTPPGSSPGWSEAVPSGAEASEAASDSLEDFRINIFSLDDLPPAASESPDLEQQEESAQRGKPSPPGSRAEAPARPGAPGRAQARSMAVAAKATSAGQGGPPTKSEVSELLSGESAASRTSASGDSAASTVSSEQSEDFEGSPSPTTSEPAGCCQAPPARSLGASSELTSSLERDAPRLPPQPDRRWAQEVIRVIVKEKAVQTPEPAFCSQWTRAAGPAALNPAPEGTYADPTPVTSHVVSADAIEALTTYSPAAFALHDLLRQQLSLTRQFLEASRQLHGSVLRALDEDSFHYHSLEEAKEFIRHHRPAPLTLEDALEQVREEP
ncbi:uncharacterized protein C19orf44 homolog isoform X3 [Tamandua tetradactyla]|uniref:uncharacterized protein C19orf44 homolog isoform X3 n=1 Tax=Tamandua tetradactyla TaxID=48850 RepID=UPI0040542979